MASRIDFDLGEFVTCDKLTEMVYDKDGKRGPVTTEIPRTKFRVVGGVHRRLGVYHKATDGGSWGGDIDPPYLAVTGTIVLLQLRKKLFGRIVEAQVDHVTSLSRLPFIRMQSPTDVGRAK